LWATCARRDTGCNMPQLQLPIFPAGVTPINPQVAVLCEAGKVAYVHFHDLVARI
jgi:hypothetical protein